jgi:hypothetical protein
MLILYCRSRDISVGIATKGWTARGRFPAVERFFLFFPPPRPHLWPIKPRIQWVLCSLFSEIKRPELEADRSAPFSADVKNGGAKTPLPISLHGLVLNSISTGTTLPFLLIFQHTLFFFFPSGGWSPNWVHSARRPLTGLLYLPRVIVRMENLVE